MSAQWHPLIHHCSTILLQTTILRDLNSGWTENPYRKGEYWIYEIEMLDYSNIVPYENCIFIDAICINRHICMDAIYPVQQPALILAILCEGN